MLPDACAYITSFFAVGQINILRKDRVLTPNRHVDDTIHIWNCYLIYIQCFCAKKLMVDGSVDRSADNIADAHQGSIQFLYQVKFAGWWGRYDKFIENV